MKFLFISTKKSIFSSFFFLFIITRCFCQTPLNELKVIRGRFLLNNKPVPDLLINVVGHGQTRSDENGEFIKELSQQDTKGYVKISLIASELKFLNFDDGIIPIPQFSDFLVDIKLTNDKDLNSYEKLKKDIVYEVNKSIKDHQYDTETLFKSIIKSYSQNYNIVSDSIIKAYEIKLLIEKEINRKRAVTVVPLLDSVFNFYITRTKDLKDVFRDYSDRIFFNEEIVQRFNYSIKSYNEAYELLNSSQGKITSLAALHFDVDKQSKIQNLIKIALNDTHKEKALLSNHLLEEVDRFNKKINGRRKKIELLSDMKLFAKSMELGLESLELEKLKVMESLKIY